METHRHRAREIIGLVEVDTIIRLTDVHYAYALSGASPAAETVDALRGIDLTIQRGEYVVILGHNGSGKSTLAKHLNALMMPSMGDVWVKGWNTKDARFLRDIRSTVGMVFQTPDNQIVSTIVEEDVAFGPENLGVPHDELVQRVDWALAQVDMLHARHRPPHMLSEGQKQRICIAGVLAMHPEVLVLDESTATLDPRGRKEVLEIVHRLNREQGVTVIAITHLMEEAVAADRVVVLEAGRIALQGTPREVFRQSARLHELQMDVPQVTQLAAALSKRVPGFPADVLMVEEFVQAVHRHGWMPAPDASHAMPFAPDDAGQPTGGAGVVDPLIRVADLTHYYMRATPLEVRAIQAVNVEVRRGEVLGVLGQTGSGKSTVIQHFNGLLRPHEGQVNILGLDMRAANVDVKTIRRRVGLVFQQPEAQLFENYVGDDIAYGPRSLKLSREDVRARVRRAMEAVGLGFEEYKDRLTFALSGGQMRRVALAGVLALEPEVLVLDEPTSGLDPQGREQILQVIERLRKQGVTLVIVSHNMEDLARLCDRLCVVSGGTTVMTGTPAQVFRQATRLHEMGLDVPSVTEVLGQLLPDQTALTVEQAVELLAPRLNAPRMIETHDLWGGTTHG